MDDAHAMLDAAPTAPGGKTEHFAYARLQHPVHERITTKYAPQRLWRDTIGHGLARATRACTRRSEKAASCATQTHAFQRFPTRLAKATQTSWSFYARNPSLLQREVLCGIAAMLLQIPETVAFSYVANLDPVVGLYATGFFGLIVGLLGGVPATIAGAAGALAVVMPQLTGSSGALRDLPLHERVEHLLVAVTLAGIFQLAFGVLGLSKAFAMIPRTAHIGFLNGLALMMLLSQQTTFEVCTNPTLRFGACEVAGELAWMDAANPTTWMTAAVVALTMAVMHWFPKVPVVGKCVPPTLVAAVVSVALEHGINRPLLHYDIRTIGDTSPLNGGLPTLALPAFHSVTDWPAVLSCAASLAAIGLFESIMTLQAVVDLTKQPLVARATQRECIAQGIGNIVCGLFAAMGGCSMIGQSTGNVLNGGRFRLSTIVSGVATFGVVLFASALIELVPVACLTGVLFIIVIHTFYWPSLRLVWHLRATDACAIVLVTALAAVVNLAVAVIAGVVWQALVNSWQRGQQLTAWTADEVVPVVVTHDAAMIDSDSTAHHTTATEHAKVYHVHGDLLFSSVAAFRPLFTIDMDPRVVVVDLRDCRFQDFSAAAALRETAMRYRDAHKLLVARNLCVESLDLLQHDVGWNHVDAIDVSDLVRKDIDDDDVSSIVDSHVALQSPLPHLRLASPSTSYHVLQH